MADLELGSVGKSKSGHSADYGPSTAENRALQPITESDANKTKPSLIERIRNGKLGAWEKRLRGHPSYSIMIVICMIYAVFMDDIRNAALEKEADVEVDAFFFVCFGVFCTDLLASLVFESHYWRSIVFLLDIVATASLLVIPLFSNALSGGGATGLALARLARLVRIMRIMRVARFAMASTDAAMQQAEKRRTDARQATQMMKARRAHNTGGGFRRPSFLGLNKFRDNTVDNQTPQLGLPPGLPPGLPLRAARSSGGDRPLSMESEIPGPKLTKSVSRTAMRKMTAIANVAQAATQRSTQSGNRSMIATTLMQRTAEKIILLVLVLVVGMQLLSFTVEDQTMKVGLGMLDEMFHTFNVSECFTEQQGQHTTLCEGTVCCSEWNNMLQALQKTLEFDGASPSFRKIIVQDTTFLDRSVSDIRGADYNKVTTFSSLLSANNMELTQLSALFSIFQTFLIFLVILIFPYLFGRDVLALVITPLELLYDRVLSIAQNPFSMLETSERNATSKSFELEMIGEALTRLTKLLQIGLGSAGTDIISQNLQSGSFSVLQAGQRMDAIFVFCGIREFAACCEVLQEECVVFVNTIADVVGRAVNRSKGAINKNLGDTFLAVWKWNTGSTRSSLPMNGGVHDASEACLKACLSILASVESSNLIQAFAWRPEVQSRLGAGFSITMGFGLHAGWAIEGAVGSEQKIDATYLSPTVNLTARLESGTRQYGVPLLMSHWFCMFLSERTQERCRKIDCVAVKGSLEPMTLIAYEAVAHGTDKAKHGNEYFALYKAGKWQQCKASMDAFLAKYPKDRPCLYVMTFMEETNFVAPKDWSGYRKLVSK